MHRILLAIRVFFAILFHGETARKVEAALVRGEAAEPKPIPRTPSAPKPPLRSEAVTLLAALQREARFVDFIQENLTGYNDAQIGAAARDVHRDCGKVLQRMFEIQPASDAEEDSPVEVPEGFDAGRFRLVGNVVGEPPFTGKMTHHGWIVQKCELPTWAGSNDAAKVIAPIEVELK